MGHERQIMKFDRATLNRFKQAYEKAKKDGDEIFTFDGVELLVTYAKYLIAHLENNIKD